METTLDSPVYRVRVSGELACFTRPEMKVERVSYEVMTPSAARGLVEAILWKPAIAWNILRIHVLAPIKWIGFQRNEVTEKLSERNIRQAMSGKTPLTPLSAPDHRAQRHTLALRDVDYVIETAFRMTPRAGSADNPAKFDDMFRRRLEQGQCYRQPYLGCREFPAAFGAQEEQFEPIPESRELGWMLYDIDFQPDADNVPHFFYAHMENGTVPVEPPRSWIEAKGGEQ